MMTKHIKLLTKIRWTTFKTFNDFLTIDADLVNELFRREFSGYNSNSQQKVTPRWFILSYFAAN